jgi:hypothetical protein
MIEFVGNVLFIMLILIGIAFTIVGFAEVWKEFK